MLPDIVIYAELLCNIRQISIAASLSSPSTQSTIAEVSADGLSVRIVHNGSSQKLILPGAVKSSRFLPVQQQDSDELSWRLPLRDSEKDGVLESIENQNIPWSASDLDTGCELRCRGCETVLVKTGRIRSWKDLPSENWAEMMDFWHCHKPTVQADEEDGHSDLTSRGYGANSSISSKDGVGFVDLTLFLLSEGDCSGVLYSLSSIDHASPTTTEALRSADASGGQAKPLDDLSIFCQTCRARVGIFNSGTLSATLFKWALTTSPHGGGASELPRAPHCLVSTLLSAMSRSGCSKSVIRPHKVDQKHVHNSAQVDHFLHLWILNSGIKFSSSNSSQVFTAIKVLYRTVSAAEADKLVESITSDVQEIGVPLEVITQITDLLTQTNQILPISQRTFRGWDVGLLDRWS